jgi:hypothetical protein
MGGRGGGEGRWFGIRRTKNGDLFLTFNNDENRFDIKNIRLELDKTIEVACSVDVEKREIVVHVNGKKAEDLTLSKNFTLKVARIESAEMDKIWTFTHYGNASAFHGFVEELMIANGVLTPEQLRFRVTAATLRADPENYTGPAPAAIQFRGKITANGPGIVTYTFARSDGSEGPIFTARFEKAGVKGVSTSWELGANYEGWVALKILTPNEILSDKARFKLQIRKAPH